LLGNALGKAEEGRQRETVLLDFEEFYTREYRRVFGACYVASGSVELARDATQEAFQRAFARWRKLAREPWVEGWVVTTALNYCRRHARLAARERVVWKPDPGRDEDISDGSRVDLLVRVRALPFRQRQAIILYYLLDLPLPSVAHLMNQTEGSVKAHLALARKKLRAALEVADA
jgi:RNA polymerase sigma-70 factor (ECF subfamily)